MTIADFCIILVAGIAAGTINTVVGSGSLITFPTLVALGYPPLLANVSNNIGLVPGSVSGVYGYRRELQGQRTRLRRLVPASLLGGLTGATLLLLLPSTVFQKVVVVLIAVALVLVVMQPTLSRRVAARRASGVPRHHDVTIGLQALVFGIILIAVLGIFLDDELQRLNATKNVLAMTVNAVASIIFITRTDIDWKVVAAIAIGSTIGGQIGAKVGRKLNPKVLRGVIVLVGLTALVRLL
jgi:uncharacterized protein